MTTTYSFVFETENENCMIRVHFIDRTNSIDKAEALAQVGHAYRRAWAKRTLAKLVQSNAHFMQLELSQNTECPFEKRLLDENWINSAVSLMQTDTLQQLYVIRLYSFILYLNIFCVYMLLNVLKCRPLQ